LSILNGFGNLDSFLLVDHHRRKIQVMGIRASRMLETLDIVDEDDGTGFGLGSITSLTTKGTGTTMG